MINYDDFKKVELKMAKILSAERVEGSEKLIKLQVDDGNRTESGSRPPSQDGAPLGVAGGEVVPRQIVAGIGKKYEPEMLIGMTIAFVVNLEPRKLMGLESNGMVLAAHDADGLPVLLSADNVPPGSAIS